MSTLEEKIKSGFSILKHKFNFCLLIGSLVLGGISLPNYNCGSENEPIPEECLDKSFGITYRADEVNSVQQTAEGGYIAAIDAFTDKDGYWDLWILKLNSNLDYEWDTVLTKGGNETGQSIRQTNDGGYIVAGFTDSIGSGAAWILKLDKKGDLMWENFFDKNNDYDHLSSIQQTTDKGYIVAGLTTAPYPAQDEGWIFKLDPNGNMEWDKTFGGNFRDWFDSIQQTSDGGYILSGYTKKNTTEEGDVGDAWVLKLDGFGNLEWEKTFDKFNSFDRLESIQQTNDGGYVTVGFADKEYSYVAEVWILKLDKQGNIEWDKTYGENQGAFGSAIQQTKDGGYIVAGSLDLGPNGGTDAWVLKLNPKGNLEWKKTFGGKDFDTANTIQQTSDGGYIVAGENTSTERWMGTAWIFKIDKNGNLECK